jgi:hypothetical protein
MIPTHPQSTDVAVSVDVPLIDGVAMVPTSIGYEVLSASGSVVQALQAATADAGKVTVTIPASANTLTEGSVRDMRLIRFTFDHASGKRQVSERYVIEAVSTLVLMMNSFQTYEEAIITRMDLPDLDGWDVADEQHQIAALVTAHDRMCRASYRYKLSQDAVMFDERESYWYVTNMRSRTAMDFAQFPDTFKTALRRAQVYEADAILSGDPVGDKRLEGVISESIGESKMFFSNKPPVRSPLTRKAMDVLGPHLYRSNRLGRA